MAELRVAVILNPRAPARARLRSAALAGLRDRAHVVAQLDTAGGEGDLARAAELVVSREPDVLVAAGGDGTAGLALRALVETKRLERTALGILPLGTGNNAARSLGLAALRDGPDALALALDAIVSGPRRAIDFGLFGERPFLGSLALGMDADVLALRNRWNRRLEPRGIDGGYALYLGSFTASLLGGGHGGRARIWLDGVRETAVLYNLAILNAPVYAGPMRFDGVNDCTDGMLDVHALASSREYLAEYPRAWLRHLAVRSGRRARPSPLLRRAREIRVDFERPVPVQCDGEELPAAASFRVQVVPCALRVCLPDPQ